MIFYGVIYKITNLVNDAVYIGQTTGELNRRFKQHLSFKSNKSMPICNAIQKYGPENFKIEEIDGANSQEELNYKEWLWIHKENSHVSQNGYNVRLGGSKGRLSETTRKKMTVIRLRNQQQAFNVYTKLDNRWVLFKKFNNVLTCCETLNLPYQTVWCRLYRSKKNEINNYKFLLDIKRK